MASSKTCSEKNRSFLTELLEGGHSVVVVVVVLQGCIGAADAGDSHRRYRRLRQVHAGDDVLKLMIGQRRFPTISLYDPETRDGGNGEVAKWLADNGESCNVIFNPNEYTLKFHFNHTSVAN